MSFYDTNPTSLGSGRIDPNPKLLATGFPVGLPEFPKTEGCHSECLEYFMTWSIWVGSSIWINFRKLDVSIQMYTTNKQNIDYQLTKVWKYLTNHPPQKKTNVIYNNQIHPPKFHHLHLPTRIPKKRSQFFLGVWMWFPEAPSRNHFPWITVSAQVTALVKSMRRVLNLGVPPPTEKPRLGKIKAI